MDRATSIFMMTVMLLPVLMGCIGEDKSTEDENKIEVLGCMDETALNYDENATDSSDLCLSMERLTEAEEVFWSSWNSEAIEDLTDPVGYRFMIDETIKWNESSDFDFSKPTENNIVQGMVVQEVFASNYYNQEIEFKRKGKCIEGEITHNMKTTVSDKHTMVNKFDGSEWENYSMRTALNYDEFRKGLENGPGIKSDSVYSSTRISIDEDRETDEDREADEIIDLCDRMDLLLRADEVASSALPRVDQTEFEEVITHNIDTSSDGKNSQLIYYLAKDTETNTHVEIMGRMTEAGFMITEYCNQMRQTWAVTDTTSDIQETYFTTINTAVRIILLEPVDSNYGEELTKYQFEEYGFEEPVIEADQMDESATPSAIPFYFENMQINLEENMETDESDQSRGLTAFEFKVLIDGSSSPYGVEGSLGDYELVLSNCTTTEATRNDSQEDDSSSGRAVDYDSTTSREDSESVGLFGIENNICSNHIFISFEEITDSESGDNELDIKFIDSDSSGTLSEGDRIAVWNVTNCPPNPPKYCGLGLNMLRIYSSPTAEFSDQNIDLVNTYEASIHKSSMDVIRNIRSVMPDEGSQFLESARSIFCGGGDDGLTGCVAWSDTVF